MASKQKFCGECGSPNILKNKYCNFCGSRFPDLAELEADIDHLSGPAEGSASGTTDSPQEGIEEPVESIDPLDPSADEYFQPSEQLEYNEPFSRLEDEATYPNNNGILAKEIARLLDHTGQLTVQGEEGVLFIVCEAQQDVLHFILSSSATFNSRQQHILEALGFYEADYNYRRSFNFLNPGNAISEGTYISQTVFEEVFNESLTSLRVIEDFGHRLPIDNSSTKSNKKNLLYITMAAAVILIFLLLVAQSWLW